MRSRNTGFRQRRLAGAGGRRWLLGMWAVAVLVAGAMQGEENLPQQIDGLMEERRWEAVVPLAERWVSVLQTQLRAAQRAKRTAREREARYHLARARHVLGSVLERTGDAVKAGEIFAEAWRDYEAAGAPPQEKAACADEAGRAALAAGQWKEAERWLRLAVSLQPEAGAPRALARVQLVEGLIRSGQPEAAARELETAAGEAGADPVAQWAVARMRGVLAHTLGHYVEALQFFAKARERAHAVLGAEAKALQAALDAQAGQALFRLGRLEEAGEALASAEAWFRRQPEDLETWTACVNNLAAFWLETGQTALARERLREILNHAAVQHPERVRHRTALLVPWLNLATAEFAEGRLAEAKTALEEAEARAQALPEVHPLRAQVALLQFALCQAGQEATPAEVLAAAREASAHARAWLTRLASVGGGEEQWLEFRRTLDPVSPLATLAATHPEAVADLADTVLATQGLVLEQRLRPAQTGGPSGLEPLSWQATVNALPPESVLVNFVWWRLLDERGFCSRSGRYGALILTPGQPPRWRDLGSAEEIEARVRRVISAARDTVAANAATRRYASLDFQLESLWELVWAPVAGEVQGARCLLLRPDGMLHFVPWAIVRAPAKDNAPTREAGAYFCQRYPEVTLLARPRPLPKVGVTGKGWWVLAVPGAPGEGVPPAPPERRGAVSRELWEELRAMPALPGVAREVAAIRQAAGRGVIVETPVAEQRAFAAVPVPEVVHFCGHGFARENDDEPWGPALQAGLVLAECASALRELAAGRSVPPERDGLLFVREAAALPLRGVSLVALSGCQTGLGHWQPGEHLEGLRHAFIVAGAQHVAATLWDVNDAAVPDFVGSFYARLARGEAPAAALWAAQREWLASAPGEETIRAALAGAWTLEAAGW